MQLVTFGRYLRVRLWWSWICRGGDRRVLTLMSWQRLRRFFGWRLLNAWLRAFTGLFGVAAGKTFLLRWGRLLWLRCGRRRTAIGLGLTAL